MWSAGFDACLSVKHWKYPWSLTPVPLTLCLTCAELAPSRPTEYQCFLARAAWRAAHWPVYTSCRGLPSLPTIPQFHRHAKSLRFGRRRFPSQHPAAAVQLQELGMQAPIQTPKELESSPGKPFRSETSCLLGPWIS